jgi:hypothetical protein
MSQFQVKSDVSNGIRKTPVFKFSLTGFAQRVGRQCRFNARRDVFKSHINLEDVRPHKEHPHFASVWLLADSKVAQPSISKFFVKIY